MAKEKKFIDWENVLSGFLAKYIPEAIKGGTLGQQPSVPSGIMATPAAQTSIPAPTPTPAPAPQTEWAGTVAGQRVPKASEEQIKMQNYLKFAELANQARQTEVDAMRAEGEKQEKLAGARLADTQMMNMAMFALQSAQTPLTGVAPQAPMMPGFVSAGQTPQGAMTMAAMQPVMPDIMLKLEEFQRARDITQAQSDTARINAMISGEYGLEEERLKATTGAEENIKTFQQNVMLKQMGLTQTGDQASANRIATALQNKTITVDMGGFPPKTMTMSPLDALLSGDTPPDKKRAAGEFLRTTFERERPSTLDERVEAGLKPILMKFRMEHEKSPDVTPEDKKARIFKRRSSIKELIMNMPELDKQSLYYLVAKYYGAEALTDLLTENYLVPVEK